MSIAEKLVTIAENQQKVFDAGVLSAYQLKGYASGEVVSISDVSPVEHNMAVKLSSKNLIPYPFSIGTVTRNGITISINDNQTLTVNGTATANTSFALISASTSATVISKAEKGKTYTLSHIGEFHNPNYISLAIYDSNGVATQYERSSNTGTTFIPQVDGRFTVALVIIAGATFDNVTIAVQLEKGTKATPHTSYIADISTVKLDALGKNLFNNDTNLIKRVDYTLADGATAQRIGYEVYLPIGTYKISATPLQEFSEIYLYGAIVNVNGVCRQEGIKIVANKATSYQPTITIENGEKFVIYDALGVGNAERTKQYFAMFDILLEVGETKTEYTPFIEPTTYTPYADGTVANVKSVYPTTTLMTDTSGVLIECEYYQDARKVKQDLTDLIISLGGLLDV